MQFKLYSVFKKILHNLEALKAPEIITIYKITTIASRAAALRVYIQVFFREKFEKPYKIIIKTAILFALLSVKLIST